MQKIRRMAIDKMPFFFCDKFSLYSEYQTNWVKLEKLLSNGKKITESLMRFFVIAV